MTKWHMSWQLLFKNNYDAVLEKRIEKKKTVHIADIIYRDV